jgi:8-oxo-dGTP pyrophosphatase MutT (NUDIX family)
MAKPAYKGTGVQFAALPFRIEADSLQVLVITSRETRRWVIPKGWPARGLRSRDVAAREAFEEAGLLGKIVGKRSVGFYHYTKRLADNQERLCRVKVFLLSVDRQLDDWPEKDQREYQWVTPQKAAQMVDEGGLAEVILTAFPAIRFAGPKATKRRRVPR